MPLNLHVFLCIAGSALNTVFMPNCGEDDQAFRSLFGVGPGTCVDLWNKLEHHGTLPRNGTAKHLLWSLHHLKVCTTEQDARKRLRTNRKTHRKWVRLMLVSITGLTPIVVRLFIFVCLLLAFAFVLGPKHAFLTSLMSLLLSRFDGRTDIATVEGRPASSQLMELTFRSVSPILSARCGSLTSAKDLVCGMRLQSASKLGRSCGSMAHFLVVDGLTSKSSHGNSSTCWMLARWWKLTKGNVDIQIMLEHLVCMSLWLTGLPNQMPGGATRLSTNDSNSGDA